VTPNLGHMRSQTSAQQQTTNDDTQLSSSYASISYLPMSSAPLRSVSLIYSPYHVGVSNVGPGKGPNFLRSHGLAQAIKDLGVTVHELDIGPVDEFEGDIAKSFEILRKTSKAVTQEHNRRSFPIVVAGNCVASVGVAAGISACEEFKEELSCVWFDAHDDFNTPDTVGSGYFDSMGISMLVGDCWKELLATISGHVPLDLKRIVHVGMRDVTDLERKRVIDHGLNTVWGGHKRLETFGQELGEKLEHIIYDRRDLAAKLPVMVHLDLDCLDVSLGQANKFAAPGGLLEQDLLDCLGSIAKHAEYWPTSLTVASFDPSYDGAENIARIAIKAIKDFVDVLVSDETRFWEASCERQALAAGSDRDESMT
jgi:arginase